MVRFQHHAKVAAAVATGVAIAAMTTGCGLSGTSNQSQDQAVSGAITGSIKFQTWNLKAKFTPYFTDLVAAFEKQHPGTKVDWIDQPADNYADKLTADAAAGTLPDVVNTSPDMAYPLYKKNVLLDLSKADPKAADAFTPESWASGVMPGSADNFALPWYLNTGPYFYNKKLFSDNGLDPAKPPTTYDELQQQALTLADKSKGNIAMLGQTPQVEDLALYGSKIMNDDQSAFTFNDAKAVALVDMYKKMYDAKALLPEALSDSYTGSGKKFMSQQVAFTSGSAYDLQNFKTQAPSLYPNVAITKALTNTGHNNMYVQSLSVPAGSQNKATAVAFAEFVTNAANQLAFAKIVNIFPSTKDSLDDPFFTAQDGTDNTKVRVAAANQLRGAINYTPVKMSDPMKKVIQREIANAMLGKKTAQQALDEAVRQCDQLLANS
jgi:multiple sugar transport system substrate-binding protein